MYSSARVVLFEDTVNFGYQLDSWCLQQSNPLIRSTLNQLEASKVYYSETKIVKTTVVFASEVIFQKSFLKTYQYGLANDIGV